MLKFLCYQEIFECEAYFYVKRFTIHISCLLRDWQKGFFYCWDCLFRYYFAGIILKIAMARSILKICSKTDNRKVKKHFYVISSLYYNEPLTICLSRK